MVKWLTHLAVNQTCVGSIPIVRPISKIRPSGLFFMGRRWIKSWRIAPACPYIFLEDNMGSNNGHTNEQEIINFLNEKRICDLAPHFKGWLIEIFPKCNDYLKAKKHKINKKQFRDDNTNSLYWHFINADTVLLFNSKNEHFSL